MPPPRHISQVLRRRGPYRLQRVTARPPPPGMRQVFGEIALDELDDVFSDTREQFERMTAYVC